MKRFVGNVVYFGAPPFAVWVALFVVVLPGSDVGGAAVAALGIVAALAGIVAVAAGLVAAIYWFSLLMQWAEEARKKN